MSLTPAHLRAAARETLRADAAVAAGHDALHQEVAAVAEEEARLRDQRRDADPAGWRQALARIAQGDVTENVNHRRSACRHCWGRGFRYQWRDPGEYAAALRRHLRDNGPCPDPAGGTGYERGRAPHPDCPACDGQGEGHVEIADTLGLAPEDRLLIAGIAMGRHGLRLRFVDRIAAARLLMRSDRRANARTPRPVPAAAPTLAAAPLAIRVPEKTPAPETRRPYRPEDQS